LFAINTVEALSATACEGGGKLRRKKSDRGKKNIGNAVHLEGKLKIPEKETSHRGGKQEKPSVKANHTQQQPPIEKGRVACGGLQPREDRGQSKRESRNEDGKGRIVRTSLNRCPGRKRRRKKKKKSCSRERGRVLP